MINVARVVAALETPGMSVSVPASAQHCISVSDSIEKYSSALKGFLVSMR
jgi:hypothetical protein